MADALKKLYHQKTQRGKARVENASFINHHDYVHLDIIGFRDDIIELSLALQQITNQNLTLTTPLRKERSRFFTIDNDDDIVLVDETYYHPDKKRLVMHLDILENQFRNRQIRNRLFACLRRLL